MFPRAFSCRETSLLPQRARYKNQANGASRNCYEQGRGSINYRLGQKRMVRWYISPQQGADLRPSMQPACLRATAQMRNCVTVVAVENIAPSSSVKTRARRDPREARRSDRRETIKDSTQWSKSLINSTHSQGFRGKSGTTTTVPTMEGFETSFIRNRWG